MGSDEHERGGRLPSATGKGVVVTPSVRTRAMRGDAPWITVEGRDRPYVASTAIAVASD